MRVFPISEARKNKIDESKENEIIGNINKCIEEESKKALENYSIECAYELDNKTIDMIVRKYELEGYSINCSYRSDMFIKFIIKW